MKLLEPTITVETSSTEQKAFGMQQSRKAFQILSDLYSDKPLAIVRELGCNAMDSHVMAGKGDIPFHIHLPNSLEPWLTIQDFGTGIKHSDIYDIYAVYFNSTKQDSNNQIGCLGLGSKSPFCYSDNFTITSIVDGEKRVYNAFFNSDGLPTISFFGMSKTTECNGVAIQIPVKEKDFDLFSHAVSKAFRFFDTRPTISGANFSWPDINPLFRGDGWKYYKGISGNHAVMGGVVYPIDLFQFPNIELSLFRKNSGLVIFFDMGELDFAPSREHLSYDESTKAAIIKKCQAIEEDFYLNIQIELDKVSNIVDALKYVLEFNYNFYFSKNVGNKLELTWKGLNINNPLRFIKDSLGGNNPTTYSWASYGRKRFSESLTFNFDAEWFVDDLPRATIPRIRQYIQTNSQKSATLFTQSQYADLVKLGFDPNIFKMVSTLPKVEYNRTSGGVRKKFPVYWFGGMEKKIWDSYEYEPSDPPTYYIEKDNTFDLNIQICDTLIIYSKKSLQKVMEFFDMDHESVVLVSPKKIQTLEQDGVLCLITELKKKIDAFVIDNTPQRSNRFSKRANNIETVLSIAKEENLHNNPYIEYYSTVAEDLQKLKIKIPDWLMQYKNQSLPKVEPIESFPVDNIFIETLEFFINSEYYSVFYNGQQAKTICKKLLENYQKTIDIQATI